MNAWYRLLWRLDKLERLLAGNIGINPDHGIMIIDVNGQKRIAMRFEDNTWWYLDPQIKDGVHIVNVTPVEGQAL